MCPLLMSIPALVLGFARARPCDYSSILKVSILIRQLAEMLHNCCRISLNQPAVVFCRQARYRPTIPCNCLPCLLNPIKHRQACSLKHQNLFMQMFKGKQRVSRLDCSTEEDWPVEIRVEVIT